MSSYKQCQQGHYYDPTIYNECPYCSGAGDAGVAGVGGSKTIPVGYAPNNQDNYQFPASFGTPGQGLQPSEPIPTIKVINNKTDDTKPDTKGKLGGETMPASLIRKNKKEENTESKDDTKFVVGWLVSIEGPYLGKSFELHNGYNNIGREKGDIVLKEDKQVSSENNISIVYDSENNSFYVIAGVSRNVAHFNGKALLSGMNKDMKAYDILKVGTSKFVFVPFCSDKYNWVDGIKQEEE